MYFIYYLRITDDICLSFYFQHLENLILSVFQRFGDFLQSYLHLSDFVQMIYNS